jgi:hypothetical protein
MKINCYDLYGGDNDSYMYIDGHPDRCEDCGAKLSHIYNLDMKIKKSRLDIFSTYDHYTIISKKLLDYLQSKNIEFKYYPLNRYTDYFLFDEIELPQIKIENYDHLKFSQKCKTCGRQTAYSSFSIDRPIIKGIYRTDLLFSDPGRESPVILIGLETYKELNQQRFKGMSFLPILSKSGLEENIRKYQESQKNVKTNKIPKKKVTKSDYIQYGEAKPLDDVYLEDMLEYPIWTWALDEEEEHDETWVYPIINTENITDDMIDVMILLQDDNGQYYSANYYTDEECIDAIYQYEEFAFVELKYLEDISYPFVLYSIPKINDMERVKFKVTDAFNKSKVI